MLVDDDMVTVRWVVGEGGDGVVFFFFSFFYFLPETV